jgi:hypothetical protein
MSFLHAQISTRCLRSINDPLCPGEYLHTYKWLHLPSKKTGIIHVASYSSDILPLLNYWNTSDEWKYVLLDNK